MSARAFFLSARETALEGGGSLGGIFLEDVSDLEGGGGGGSGGGGNGGATGGGGGAGKFGAWCDVGKGGGGGGGGGGKFDGCVPLAND